MANSVVLAGILLVAGHLPTSASAQADGTPIRVQTAAKPGKWITGRAQGITPDSIGIVLKKTSDTVWYARGELQRMDVSTGRKSNAGRGALIGAGVGLVVGAVGVATTDWSDCDDSMSGESGCVVAGAAVVGISIGGGAAAGAIIGAFSHREKWKGVRLRTQVSQSPQGSVRFGLGLTF